MDCESCGGDGRFRAYYCDKCKRWHLQVKPRDLLAAIAVVAVVVLIVTQPELLAPVGAVVARYARRGFA